MTQTLEYIAPPPPRRPSPAGFASFVIALLAPCYVGLLGLLTSGPAGDKFSQPVMIALFSTALVLPAAGLPTGIASLRAPHRRRGYAIAGVTLNGMMLLYFAFIIAVTVIAE